MHLTGLWKLVEMLDYIVELIQDRHVQSRTHKIIHFAKVQSKDICSIEPKPIINKQNINTSLFDIF